jgi:K+-sensing histidine kinase KdpD
MNRLDFFQHKSFPYIAVSFAFLLYVVIFALSHDHAGIGIASLAVLPVIVASWYFGIKSGILTAILSVLSNIVILVADGHLSEFEILSDAAGFLSLLLIGIVVGLLGTVTRERREALLRLEALDKKQQLQMNFLELLNGITGMALESNSLESTLNILVERMAGLFEADDVFFAFWDPTHSIPVPRVAYGSMSEIYPYMQFESGERTPTTAAIESGHPITITDLDNSPYIDSKIASVFPSRSMLALPLL